MDHCYRLVTITLLVSMSGRQFQSVVQQEEMFQEVFCTFIEHREAFLAITSVSGSQELSLLLHLRVVSFWSE